MREKIICLAPVSEKPVTPEYIKQTYREWIDFDKVDLVVIQAGRNTDQFIKEVADATILCSYGTPRIPVPRRILENASHLKLIQQLGVGYDDIDIVAAEELDIPVCNTQWLQQLNCSRAYDNDDTHASQKSPLRGPVNPDRRMESGNTGHFRHST